jgi:hypothetical protein
MNGLVTVLRAADAAARWHVNQRRKGAAQEPYVTHLLEVAMLVAEATDGADPNLIVAALLHDTIEDQGVTREEIAARFNDDVANLVIEVTDNKKLPKAERKQLQIKNAPKLTARAKILKFADKISNLRSLATSPPADWPMQRRIDYVIWTTEVVQGQAYSNRNSIGLRRMLSGQFPWRQKAAECRCRRRHRSTAAATRQRFEAKYFFRSRILGGVVADGHRCRSRAMTFAAACGVAGVAGGSAQTRNRDCPGSGDQARVRKAPRQFVGVRPEACCRRSQSYHIRGHGLTLCYSLCLCPFGKISPATEKLQRENESLFCKLARTQTELRTKRAYATRLENLLHQRNERIDDLRGRLEQSQAQVRQLSEEADHLAQLFKG